MAQYRQYGGGGANGLRNGGASDYVSIGVRGASRYLHHRRSKPPPVYRISIGFCALTLVIILFISTLFYFSLQSKGGDMSRNQSPDHDLGIDADFLMNVTRTPKTKELKFGRGSDTHGRDSHYWDKDDRRRDSDYEEEMQRAQVDSPDKIHTEVNNRDSKSSDKSHKISNRQVNGLYNEAGRDELKLYEAKYEASLNDTDVSSGRYHRALDDVDEYDDGIDLQDDIMEEYDDIEHDEKIHSGATDARNKQDDADKASSDLRNKGSLLVAQSQHHSRGHDEDQPSRKLLPEKHPIPKKKSKHRKFSGACEMKIANSSALLVEPVQSRKFARFSLQYTEREEKPIGDVEWEPRFAGHQSLREREESFISRDQKINCGFVKGPEGSPSTGFDLAENDARYISSCHIAVMSCIFGNSDRLRLPLERKVSRFSRKNVCFVMFVDEVTLETLSSEGQMPDMMGFVGLWKIVVVKNLPYTDMRRVGKIPKLLPHRLFSSARYSIWLDSKLRLQLDPLVILEYFLWRKGHEYAISNHYDRHCLWEEVAQNKRLNKYNHSVIDEQFGFYKSDGMKRFNASDPNKFLPSNVPEGSFIVRAHTPMSNLFSCLWFNEIERFTPRDQLSFAYTYHKLRWMNPDKKFYLNMFKDCERRKIAKLYRHRSDEKRNNPQHETE